jgi:hypothetical protein
MTYTTLHYTTYTNAIIIFLSHKNLLSELRLESGDLCNYLRVDEELQQIIPRTEQSETFLRRVFTPHERHSITHRFLATGKNFEDIRFSAAISPRVWE